MIPRRPRRPSEIRVRVGDFEVRKLVANLPPGSLSMAFFFSLETFATVGYGVMAPATLYGHLVSSAEILAGVVFTAIMTGLIFMRFSRPRARLIFADRMVVAREDGIPTLMVRLANASSAPLVEASARLTALINGVTTEGRSYRRSVELTLVRPRLPVFALSWTLMHRLDDGSPLCGCSEDEFAALVTRLYLSVQARDPMLVADVLDIHEYSVASIAFGMRYVDTISFSEGHAALVDLTHLSFIEPDVGMADGMPPDVAIEITGMADSAS
jgi:inward rectifier potassium channel